MKETSPPVSAMTTPTNGNGNLVDEFEEAFQHCLNVLTKEEAVPTVDKDEAKVEVDQTTMRFIDLARQMEAFFLQKRFLLSALKPEITVKEDITELRLELARKDELLKRHYDKIALWQNLLADLQGYSKSPAQGSSTPVLNNGSSVSNSPIPSIAGNQGSSQMISGISPVLQQQLQQQQLQQQQMQVPSGINTNPVGTSLMSPQQAMFMQHGMSGAGSPFPQTSPGSVLQGPLAYLEKTTSNIDLGMTDGRR